jgi:hypothetical protein
MAFKTTDGEGNEPGIDAALLRLAASYHTDAKRQTCKNPPGGLLQRLPLAAAAVSPVQTGQTFSLSTPSEISSVYLGVSGEEKNEKSQ